MVWRWEARRGGKKNQSRATLAVMAQKKSWQAQLPVEESHLASPTSGRGIPPGTERLVPRPPLDTTVDGEGTVNGGFQRTQTGEKSKDIVLWLPQAFLYSYCKHRVPGCVPGTDLCTLQMVLNSYTYPGRQTVSLGPFYSKEN